MKESLNMDVEIVPCEISREPSGLASSSRNRRLSESELEEADIIYRTLSNAKEWATLYRPEMVTEKARQFFKRSKLKLEYLEIVDPITLKPLENWIDGARMCIAAYCGDVRLIDNMELIEC
jgi:pantothenate synthetase